MLGGLQHFEYALLVQHAGEDDGDILEGGDAAADKVFELFVGLVVFLDEVPFVDHNHHAFVVALDEGEDIQILHLQPLAGIEHQDTDIAVLDGADTAHDGIELQVFTHFRLLAEAGGVDKVEVESEHVVAGIDAVACGAGDRGYDVAFLSGDEVDE